MQVCVTICCGDEIDEEYDDDDDHDDDHDEDEMMKMMIPHRQPRQPCQPASVPGRAILRLEWFNMGNMQYGKNALSMLDNV